MRNVMVNVKELRIGNRVYLPSLSKEAYGNERVPFLVEGIYKGEDGYKVLCHCDTKDGYSCTEDALPEEIEPIPLTEELLLKCGFKRTLYGSHNGIELSCMSFIFDEIVETKNEWFLSMNHGKHVMSCSHIRYIHQLQNIYSDLIGDELNFEL